MQALRKRKSIGPNICLLDIEATSLEADVGVLIGSGVMDIDGRFSFIPVSSFKMERNAIAKTLKKLSAYHIVVTWNGKIFDIPFLLARALFHGLNVDPIMKIYHLDLADFVKNNLKLSRTDIFHVSRFLGIKKDISTLGQDVPSLYIKSLNGDRRAMGKIRRHCKDDLEVLRKLFSKLKPLIKISMPHLPLE